MKREESLFICKLISRGNKRNNYNVKNNLYSDKTPLSILDRRLQCWRASLSVSIWASCFFICFMIAISCATWRPKHLLEAGRHSRFLKTKTRKVDTSHFDALLALSAPADSMAVLQNTPVTSVAPKKHSAQIAAAATHQSGTKQPPCWHTCRNKRHARCTLLVAMYHTHVS